MSATSSSTALSASASSLLSSAISSALSPTTASSLSPSALSSLSSQANVASSILSSLTETASSLPVPTGNLSSSILDDPGPVYSSYTPALFLVGLAITLAASMLNALGINLQKLDHVRALSLPAAQRRPEFLRPVWVVGLTTYIVSQVLGSTLALQYMRAEYVAPLGSTSLVFNFLLARWLLGTEITKLDLIGTFVVILGVCGVVGFGAIRSGGTIDQDANMSLSTLHALWARGVWIAYFIGLEVVTLGMLWVASVMDETVFEREAVEEDRNEGDDNIAFASLGGRRQTSSFFSRLRSLQRSLRTASKSRLTSWAASRPDASIRKLCGLFWALTAGLLAGQTLLFAKSFVKVVTNATDSSGRGSGSDLADPLTIFIAILLAVTAVAQIWCLNRGLRVYDSTLIVPCLFASYTATGWLGSLIYLDELSFYRTWVLCLVWLSILVLVIGVVMLSSKKPEGRKRSESKDGRGWRADLDPEGEAQESALGAAEEGKRPPVRPRSDSILSLKAVGQKLREPFSRRRSSAASGASPVPSSSHPAYVVAAVDEDSKGLTSALPEEDEEDLDEDEVDRLEMVPTMGKDGLPGYSRAGADDEDEEDEEFGGFGDAKK